MVKVSKILKWLPLIVATIGVFLYSISGRNFFHNIFSFIIGDPYGPGGLCLSIVWLTSLVWVVVKEQQIEANPGEGPSSLYRILDTREHYLLHVSAKPYIETTKRVIAEFKPAPVNEPINDTDKESTEIQSVQQSTSISGNFNNSGAKKEEAKNAETESKSKKSDEESVNKPVNQQPVNPIEKGPLANVNTSLKGVSLVDTEEKSAKLRANIKNFGSKRKEAKQE